MIKISGLTYIDQQERLVTTDIDIAARLRQIRTARGLSQRALARRVGVPNSTISLIESGRSNPTIGALKRILDGIPVGLAEFFAFEPEAPKRYFFAAHELREIGKGRISYRQIGESGTARALQMLAEVYQPGADTGKVPLSHQGEEVGLVLSGRLEVTVDGQRKHLGPGDAYAFESHLPHRFRNPGSEPCHVVSACTPPTF
ncbi:cupin domain-containing protein [Kaustia mangrovi]|uniref:Cupin domain-containing protein n=1 Tax=Kaustia mangrovi TaxID=2593653 RepID=A0A7S8C6E8_9HYPH|nr:cupin domain-containing protein [Kaustia mangrovi]